MSLLLKFLLFSIFTLYLVNSVISIEDEKENYSDEDSSAESSEESKNGTAQDLYVIKTTVYEIGILTDVGNDTDNNLNETHEKVDLSFYDPKNNSFIDLTHIPIPIQTNVSGITVTGILPTNLSSIGPNATGDLNGVPIIPNNQFKITRNISTSNPEKGAQIISSLPSLLGLDKVLTKNNNSESDN